MTSERRDPDRLGNREKVDRASEDSFPASDPPSYSGITGPGEPNKTPPAAKPDEAKPTGRPTSERHKTETAQQDEDQETPQTPKRGGR